MMIGDSEIHHMKSTLILGKRNQDDATWRLAFFLYNKTVKRPLRLTCPACYAKVLKYHMDKLNGEKTV